MYVYANLWPTVTNIDGLEDSLNINVHHQNIPINKKVLQSWIQTPKWYFVVSTAHGVKTLLRHHLKEMEKLVCHHK